MRRIVVGLVSAFVVVGSIAGAPAAPALVRSADLRIVGAYGTPARTGAVETFSVGVANHGPTGATAVQLEIHYPDEFTYSSTTGDCTPTDGNTVVCSFGKIVSGHTKQTTVSLLAVAGGRARLTLNGSSATSDPDPSNNESVWKIRVLDDMPVLTVTPSTELVDLEHVHVKLTNVPAGEYVVWECDANFPEHGMYDCMTLGSGVYDPPYNTAMKTAVKVHAGPIGSATYGGSCGTSESDNDCFVIVSPFTTGVPDFTGMPSVPISFAVSS